MTSKFRQVAATSKRLLHIDRYLDQIKINQGRLLVEAKRDRIERELWHHEFKVFSQWGEDGIIQFLTRNLDVAHRTFIEFGVEDFSESNCRFLLMKDHWQGFVIDGSSQNIESLRSSYFYWQHALDSEAAFITRENVDELLSRSGFDRELGILSVDIDGVDYYVLEALHAWRPSILIVEYNGVLGSQRAVSVPYDPGFWRTAKHASNLYYGASLPAFVHLAGQRGYSLVGVNGVGSNAFFVRNDLLNDRVQAVSLTECYRDSTFREGRDGNGRLSFLAKADRRGPIASLPLVDVITGEPLTVSDLTG